MYMITSKYIISIIIIIIHLYDVISMHHLGIIVNLHFIPYIFGKITEEGIYSMFMFCLFGTYFFVTGFSFIFLIFLTDPFHTYISDSNIIAIL